jgi:hypothetical protein
MDVILNFKSHCLWNATMTVLSIKNITVTIPLLDKPFSHCCSGKLGEECIKCPNKSENEIS